MRLNARGQAAMGVGDGTVSVDGQVIAQGGGACWVDAGRVLYQRQAIGQPYILETYRVHDGVTTMVDPHGANELAAGGGLWAAWGPGGVRTNTGLVSPVAGLLDVSPEGALVLCPDRQTGQSADIYWPDGTTTRVVEARASAVRLRGRVLVWTQGGQIHAWNMAPPTTIAGPLYTPVPVQAGTDWWVIYQDGGRLLLQPWGAPVGYVVHDQPTTFSPDAVALDAHTIRVAWSHTAGEAPTALRVVDVDLLLPRVRLDRPSVPPEPPVAEPNYKPQVQAARAVYASRPGSVERGWLITNEAVRRINLVDPKADFGLLAKTTGTNWTGYSIDCVMRKTGETWDVLGDAEGAATPQWTRTTPTGMTDPAKWRPYVVVPETEPPPTEPPPAGGYDDTELRARLVALEQWAASFRRG